MGCESGDVCRIDLDVVGNGVPEVRAVDETTGAVLPEDRTVGFQLLEPFASLLAELFEFGVLGDGFVNVIPGFGQKIPPKSASLDESVPPCIRIEE